LIVGEYLNVHPTSLIYLMEKCKGLIMNSNNDILSIAMMK
jgi:hypothetical protein